MDAVFDECTAPFSKELALDLRGVCLQADMSFLGPTSSVVSDWIETAESSDCIMFKDCAAVDKPGASELVLPQYRLFCSASCLSDTLLLGGKTEMQ